MKIGMLKKREKKKGKSLALKISLKTQSLSYCSILNHSVNLIICEWWKKLQKIQVQVLNKCNLDKCWGIMRNEYLIVSELQVNDTEPWLFSRDLTKNTEYLFISSGGGDNKKQKNKDVENMTSVDFVKNILCWVALVKFY